MNKLQAVGLKRCSKLTSSQVFLDDFDRTRSYIFRFRNSFLRGIPLSQSQWLFPNFVLFLSRCLLHGEKDFAELLCRVRFFFSIEIK